MKNKVLALVIILVIGLTLSACSTQRIPQPPTTTDTVEPADPPTVSPTVRPSNTPLATATMLSATATIPLVTQEPVSFPLSEPGPYNVGKREYTIVDESRNNRQIQLTIWYPALKKKDDANRLITFNAEPDLSGAPYPLILTDHDSGLYLFQSHLASHGFVMAIVDPQGFSNEMPWNNYVIDVPHDFLFVLDMFTSNPPEGLGDVLDTNRVGVGGYSSGGLFSLALGGARINPEFYLSQCAQAPSLDFHPRFIDVEYFCNLSERWDEFSSQVGAEISMVSEGLWQPTSDDRILAIMPMAPDSAWLYGSEGLAAINLPSLIIAGTDDQLISYELSPCYIYKHLVNSDSILISFIDEQHMMVMKKEIRSRINHFAVAFFGYYLQGKTDYADYFSEDFVSQFDDLFWGVYPGE
jgi:predicted dienelactone hydrolase